MLRIEIHRGGSSDVWFVPRRPLKWRPAAYQYRTDEDVLDYQAITCFPEWEEGNGSPGVMP